MNRSRRPGSDLLTGEWACLGLLNLSPAHGFALARELAPTGDIGRIWSLSRPLTYRAIDQLLDRGYIEPRSEEPGRAGGSRIVYAPTRAGRAAFRTWLSTPVRHLRELRSNLLLKIVLARRCGIPVDEMIEQQLAVIEDIRSGLARREKGRPDDMVVSWRLHSIDAAMRFLGELRSSPSGSRHLV